MKQRLIAGLIAAVVLTFNGTASATVIDATRITSEPAATLLLPYFEVDLPVHQGGKSPKGPDTVVNIGTVDRYPAIAHVTLWTDLGIPALNFDVFLTGYDMQAIDVRDAIEGRLPQTGSETVAGNCKGRLRSPQLSRDAVAHVRASLTGKMSPQTHQCSACDHGERHPLARGYITVDTVSDCTTRNPGDTGYFAAGGTGDATDDNVLWGDYTQIGRGSRYADSLVAMRADASDPQTSAITGKYTFYGRYVPRARDNRQPLADVFAVRYVNQPGRHAKVTSLIVWRDPKAPQISGFPCGTLPDWVPLGQNNIVVFDDQENAFSFDGSPFPYATQKVDVNSKSFPIAPRAGWIYLNLDFEQIHGNPGFPAEDPSAAQAWVTPLERTKHGPTVSRGATVLQSAAGSS